MDDRQYGQRGYRDHGKDRQEKPTEPSVRSGAPAMLSARTLSRCADCGTTLPPLTESSGQCPKCKSELHSCRQCVHFDPGRRFECTQPVPERISTKGARNECTYFSLSVTVEPEVHSRSARPYNPRSALDNLFKKK
jgi:hypothetical protein